MPRKRRRNIYIEKPFDPEDWDEIDITPDNTKPIIKIIYRTISIILVIYIQLSLFAMLPNSGREKEIVSKHDTKKYFSTSKIGSHKGVLVNIQTNLSNEYTFDGGVSFKDGDTITVCKNIFGKKTGVEHKGVYFPFDKQFGLLILLAILTTIFCAFNLFGDYRIKSAFYILTGGILFLLILYWTS